MGGDRWPRHDSSAALTAQPAPNRERERADAQRSHQPHGVIDRPRRKALRASPVGSAQPVAIRSLTVAVRGTWSRRRGPGVAISPRKIQFATSRDVPIWFQPARGAPPRSRTWFQPAAGAPGRSGSLVRTSSGRSREVEIAGSNQLGEVEGRRGAGFDQLAELSPARASRAPSAHGRRRPRGSWRWGAARGARPRSSRARRARWCR